MALSASLGQLAALRTLGISEVIVLPQRIGQRMELQTLHLSANHLTGLPETFGQ